MRFSVVIVAGLALTAGAPVLAAGSYFDDVNKGFVDKEPVKLMDAGSLPLPPAPKPEALVEYDLGPAARYQLSLDTSSIAVGEDQVVRFVMVIRSSGGARNVSYVGVNCKAIEYTTYAWGEQDGSWRRVDNPRWRYLENDQAHPHMRELARNLLCDHVMPAGTGAQIAAQLKKNASRY